MPNAVGDEFTARRPGAEGDYVLAVGTLEPRKNLARLVEAAGRTDGELRVVGARGWGGVEVGGNGVRWLGEVDDDGARRVSTAARPASPTRRSTRASAFRCWRRWRCGAPVVTTRGTAMEEVADGAAVLVDARDPAEIAAGIERGDRRARRSSCRAASSVRARSRWDAVAAATVDVYREAAA